MLEFTLLLIGKDTMLILTQNKHSVVNMDRVASISFDGQNRLMAYSDGMNVMLGQYPESRCLEILQIIHAFTQFKNTYVMPKE